MHIDRSGQLPRELDGIIAVSRVAGAIIGLHVVFDDEKFPFWLDVVEGRYRRKSPLSVTPAKLTENWGPQIEAVDWWEFVTSPRERNSAPSIALRCAPILGPM
jgi:hypothetical protein